MKQFLAHLLICLALVFRVAAQEIPPKPLPGRAVNDLAKQLSSSEVAQLEQKLIAYKDSTSSEIIIVIVPSLNGYPIADYAFELGEKWGVGRKGKDNGAALIWAPGDRKIFLATGLGLEGAIPDIIAKRITADVIAPKFKQKLYYEGLNDGLDAIFKYASGEYKADQTAKEDSGSPSPLIIFLIVFFIILFIMFRNKNNGGGGLRRSSRGLGGPVFWPYTTFTGGGGSSGNWGGGGGGGGGFGDFGGGSFGGGGAGSDY